MKTLNARDDLTEAQGNVATFESGMWWTVTALVISVVFVVGGSAVQDLLPFLGGAGLALVIVGPFGILFSIIFGINWVTRAFTNRSVYERLNSAQKEYDRAQRDDAS